jgi:hypothetical protein
VDAAHSVLALASCVAAGPNKAANCDCCCGIRQSWPRTVVQRAREGESLRILWLVNRRFLLLCMLTAWSPSDRNVPSCNSHSSCAQAPDVGCAQSPHVQDSTSSPARSWSETMNSINARDCGAEKDGTTGSSRIFNDKYA